MKDPEGLTITPQQTPTDPNGPETSSTNFNVPRTPSKELPNSQTTMILRLILGKEKNMIFCGYYIIALPSFVINLLNTRDRKGPICLYYGPWLERE